MELRKQLCRKQQFVELQTVDEQNWRLRFSPVRPSRSSLRQRGEGQVSAVTHNHDAPKEGEHHAGSLFQTAVTYRATPQ